MTATAPFSLFCEADIDNLLHCTTEIFIQLQEIVIQGVVASFP